MSGRIKQSLAHWCLDTAGWDLDRMIEVAKALGCPSVELVDPADWGRLKDAGLVCAIALNNMPGAPFVKGLNNLACHDEVIGNTTRMIDACGASAGVCSQVIAFTGYKWRDPEDPDSGTTSLEEGAENCVTGLRTLGEQAAKVGVSIAVEQLNTRDDTHPMKGHPGYQGEDIEYVADIIDRVNMPNVKLLFDLYHVQIMNGDLVRRIHQYADRIGHVHVAGNPGRGELHLDDQEINFPACMRALADAGYDGYVGQEWIPTTEGDGVYASLEQAVRLCDV